MFEIRMDDVSVLKALDDDGELQAVVFQDPKSGILVRIEIAGQPATRMALTEALADMPAPVIPHGSVATPRLVVPREGEWPTG